MIECPQCGIMNEDDVKNCGRCRVNMYWAFQHYEDLAAIRARNKLIPRPETPPFLSETSQESIKGRSLVGYTARSRNLALKVQGKRYRQ